MTISALESYLALLLTRARYGRKLGALAHCAYRDIEKINAIESDQSLPAATRKRLVRECEASIGAAMRLAAKHGTAQRVADAVSKHWPRQSNQENVFKSYCAGRRLGTQSLHVTACELISGRVRIGGSQAKAAPFGDLPHSERCFCRRRNVSNAVQQKVSQTTLAAKAPRTSLRKCAPR